MKSTQSDTPFMKEAPRLLREQGMSLRGLAREIGISDSRLSRALRRADYKRANPDLVGKVAVALGLPRDYFPEFREAYAIERVRFDAKLRDQLYARLTR